MRCFSMSLALLCVLISAPAFSQDLTRPVTYKTVAVPAREAMADLAKLSHQDLRIDDFLGEQPLILRLKDVPLKDAMDRIASTLHGFWSQNRAQFTLMRTDDITAKLEQAAIQKRLDQITKHFQKALKDRAQTPLDIDSALAIVRQQKQQQDEMLKEVQDMEKRMKDGRVGANGLPSQADMEEMGKAYQKQEEARQATAHQSGDGRLYDRVVAAIDPSAFLLPYTENRVVFSTNPKPLQVKLQMTDEEFEDLIAEQNVWTEALKKANDQSDEESFMPRKKINPADARVVAIASYSPGELPYNLQIYIVDSNGNQLVESDPSTTIGDFAGQFEEWKAVDYGKQSIPPVKLSPLAREMFAVTNAQQQNGADAVRPASDALHQFFLDSKNHDPLSLAVSEILIGIAEGKSWNMVASPPDDLATQQFGGTADAVMGESFLEVCSMDKCDVGMDGGWLTLSPRDPLKAESDRTNRESLGRMLAAVDRLGYASIDDMAAFAAANGPKVDVSLVSSYLNLCHPSIASFDGIDMPTLRFYGLLSGDQRSSLFQGNKVPFLNLSQDQQEALEPLLLNPSSTEAGDDKDSPDSDGMTTPLSSPSDDQAPIKQSAGGSPDTAATDDAEPDYQPLSNEITEYLTQVQDPSVKVGMQLKEDQAIHVKATVTASNDGTPRQTVMMDGRHMGFMTGMSGDSWSSPDELPLYLVRKRPNITYTFAVGPEIVVNLRMVVGGKLVVLSTLSEHHRDTTPFGPYEKLPADIRKVADEAMKEYQQYQQVDNSDVGGDQSPDAQEPTKKVDPPR